MCCRCQSHFRRPLGSPFSAAVDAGQRIRHVGDVNRGIAATDEHGGVNVGADSGDAGPTVDMLSGDQDGIVVAVVGNDRRLFADMLSPLLVVIVIIHETEAV